MIIIEVNCYEMYKNIVSQSLLDQDSVHAHTHTDEPVCPHGDVCVCLGVLGAVAYDFHSVTFEIVFKLLLL